jgi:hypothetical protein
MRPEEHFSAGDKVRAKIITRLAGAVEEVVLEVAYRSLVPVLPFTSSSTFIRTSEISLHGARTTVRLGNRVAHVGPDCNRDQHRH